MSLFHLARLLILPLLALLLLSCETTKTGTDSAYASNYGTDGRYNPYPGQSGYAQGGGSRAPAYEAPNYEAPPAPAEADPYAFESPASASKPSTTAPKKSTATAAAKPKSTGTGTGTSAAKKSGSSGYTVVKGDTLYGIARKKGSTVAKIKSANGLSSDLIRIGQKLKIP